MIKTKTKRQRNPPPIYKYGYHITPIENLENILTNGLKRELNVSIDYGKRKFQEKLYGTKSPIWLYTTSNFQHISSWSKSYFYKYKYVGMNKLDLIILKIDISNFEQYPDIEPLIHELDFDINIYNTMWSNYSNKYVENSKLIMYWKNLKNKIPSRFTQYIKNYKNIIPVSEFTKNINLIKDIMSFTHTLCIVQDIPSKCIVNYKNIDWNEIFGDTKYEWMDVI